LEITVGDYQQAVVNLHNPTLTKGLQKAGSIEMQHRMILTVLEQMGKTKTIMDSAHVKLQLMPKLAQMLKLAPPPPGTPVASPQDALMPPQSPMETSGGTITTKSFIHAARPEMPKQEAAAGQLQTGLMKMETSLQEWRAYEAELHKQLGSQVDQSEREKTMQETLYARRKMTELTTLIRQQQEMVQGAEQARAAVAPKPFSEIYGPRTETRKRMKAAQAELVRRSPERVLLGTTASTQWVDKLTDESHSIDQLKQLMKTCRAGMQDPPRDVDSLLKFLHGLLPGLPQTISALIITLYRRITGVMAAAAAPMAEVAEVPVPAAAAPVPEAAAAPEEVPEPFLPATELGLEEPEIDWTRFWDPTEAPILASDVSVAPQEAPQVPFEAPRAPQEAPQAPQEAMELVPAAQTVPPRVPARDDESLEDVSVNMEDIEVLDFVFLKLPIAIAALGRRADLEYDCGGAEALSGEVLRAEDQSADHPAHGTVLNNPALIPADLDTFVQNSEIVQLGKNALRAIYLLAGNTIRMSFKYGIIPAGEFGLANRMYFERNPGSADLFGVESKVMLSIQRTFTMIRKKFQTPTKDSECITRGSADGVPCVPQDLTRDVNSHIPLFRALWGNFVDEKYVLNTQELANKGYVAPAWSPSPRHMLQRRMQPNFMIPGVRGAYGQGDKDYVMLYGQRMFLVSEQTDCAYRLGRFVAETSGLRDKVFIWQAEAGNIGGENEFTPREHVSLYFMHPVGDGATPQDLTQFRFRSWLIEMAQSQEARHGVLPFMGMGVVRCQVPRNPYEDRCWPFAVFSHVDGTLRTFLNGPDMELTDSQHNANRGPLLDFFTGGRYPGLAPRFSATVPQSFEELWSRVITAVVWIRSLCIDFQQAMLHPPHEWNLNLCPDEFVYSTKGHSTANIATRVSNLAPDKPARDPSGLEHAARRYISSRDVELARRWNRPDYYSILAARIGGSCAQGYERDRCHAARRCMNRVGPQYALRPGYPREHSADPFIPLWFIEFNLGATVFVPDHMPAPQVTDEETTFAKHAQYDQLFLLVRYMCMKMGLASSGINAVTAALALYDRHRAVTTGDFSRWPLTTDNGRGLSFAWDNSGPAAAPGQTALFDLLHRPAATPAARIFDYARATKDPELFLAHMWPAYPAHVPNGNCLGALMDLPDVGTKVPGVMLNNLGIISSILSIMCSNSVTLLKARDPLFGAPPPNLVGNHMSTDIDAEHVNRVIGSCTEFLEELERCAKPGQKTFLIDTTPLK
jgi:hypothetical protein